MTGVHHHLEPLTWSTGLTSWTFAYWWDLVILLLAAAYFTGLVRLRRRAPHQVWPKHRTAFFTAGLVSWLLTMNSSIAVYSHPMFTMHMVQHLMLIMVVPALLVYGKPLRLWVELDASGRVENVLRGRVVGYFTHPVLTMVLYAVVLVATHLTSFMQVMLLNPWLHHAEAVLYLVTGYLTFLPLVGNEPIRWQRFPYSLRVFASLMAMGPDTGIGVILMMAPDPMWPAYARMQNWPGWDLVADQRIGGAIMWFFGDAIMALFALVLVRQWIRAKGPESGFGNWLESARRSALAETSGDGQDAGLSQSDDVDDDERARQAYNAMLARLAEQERGGSGRA